MREGCVSGVGVGVVVDVVVEKEVYSIPIQYGVDAE